MFICVCVCVLNCCNMSVTSVATYCHVGLIYSYCLDLNASVLHTLYLESQEINFASMEWPFG